MTNLTSADIYSSCSSRIKSLLQPERCQLIEWRRKEYKQDADDGVLPEESFITENKKAQSILHRKYSDYKKCENRSKKTEKLKRHQKEEKQAGRAWGENNGRKKLKLLLEQNTK